MKLPVLLLAASATLNAALVTVVVLRPTLFPAALREHLPADKETTRAAAESRRAAQASAARAEAARAKAEAEARRVWLTLDSADLRTFVARLRAAGFPASVIRAVVAARIEGQFTARMNALAGVIEATPFWKPTPLNSYTNPKLTEERSQIYRDRARLFRELLGDDLMTATLPDPTAAQRRRYGDLPKAKIDLLARIEDDYAEMIGSVRAATQGIMLPEDREKIALLEREKRADLAAILQGPALEDYEMRNSSITLRLRSGLTLMNATEDEFRTIFRLRQQFPDPNDLGGAYFYSSEAYQQRQEREKQLAAQLATALGPARYAEYERATNYEFQNLARLAQRENLGLDVAVRAYELRASTATESMRLYNDKTLTGDQKIAALQALASATKNQLATLLGPTSGPAYAQGASWLNYIAGGRAISFSGTTTSIMSPPAAVPPRK